MGLFIPSFVLPVGVMPLKKSFIERIPFCSYVIQIDYHTKMEREHSFRSIIYTYSQLCTFFPFGIFLLLPSSYPYSLMFSVVAVRQLVGDYSCESESQVKKMEDCRGRDVIKSVFSISAIHFVFYAKEFLCDWQCAFMKNKTREYEHAFFNPPYSSFLENIFSHFVLPDQPRLVSVLLLFRQYSDFHRSGKHQDSLGLLILANIASWVFSHLIAKWIRYQPCLF